MSSPCQQELAEAQSDGPERATWFCSLLHSWSVVGELWTSGLAALLITAFLALFGLGSESREWGLYLTLGTLFPLLVLGLWALEHSLRKPAIIKDLHVLLGLAAIAGIAWVIWVIPRQGPVTTMSMVLAWATVIVYEATPRILTPESRTSLAAVFTAWIVSCFSWFGALHCVFWTRPWDFFAARYAAGVLSVSLVLVAVVFVRNRRGRLAKYTAAAKIARECALFAIAAVLFAALSFRTDALVSQYFFHHWSFWIGPAQSLREGGWLLWDTPSQYVFLSILLIAAMPIASIWESLYVLQAALLWSTALIVYCLLRRRNGTLFNYLFALLTTVASVYFMSRWPASLSGVQPLPSAGPMRFFWCYALLLCLQLCLGRDLPRPRLFRRLGAILWVCGTLWSVENGIYCTAIYGAAIVTLAFQTAAEKDLTLSTLTTALWNALAAPALLLLTALAAVYSFSVMRLGHAPDWLAYLEYALLYQGGFGALPIEANGPVWLLVTTFCILSILSAALLSERPGDPRLAVVMGAWAAIWAISSYFVSRSHPNNADNLAPLLVAAPAISLPALDRLPGRAIGLLVRHATMPVFIVCIAVIFGNPALFNLKTNPWRDMQDIETRLPVAEGGLSTLLYNAHIGETDALAIDHRAGLPPRVRVRTPQCGEIKCLPSWLPQPTRMFQILPRERRAVYLDRRMERLHPSGWYISDSSVIENDDAWFLSQLATTHTVTEAGTIAPYTLYRCEPKTAPPTPEPPAP